MHTEWTDRLSDYLDGHLDPEETKRVDAHLAECETCTTVLEELRAVVLRARSLDDTAPPRDLWPGIRAAMQAGPQSRVIDLSARLAAGGARRRWTVRLSASQLVAAALALVLVSGGTAWLARPDVGTARTSGETALEPAVPSRTVEEGASPTRTGDPGDGSHAGELAELEELLVQHRDSLSPKTVRILERNLAAIDRAITESLQALESDPGNEFLRGHLERARQRKLEYLREASVAFQWAT